MRRKSLNRKSEQLPESSATADATGAAQVPAQPIGGAVPREPLIDVKRLVYSAHTTFNPLHRESLFECQAVGSRDGMVLLNVALPSDMSRFFVALLESMTGFFRVMDTKSRVASSHERWIDPQAVEDREKRQREFINSACSLFDGFIADGKSMNEAVKLTNAALKVQNHPWASYGVVSSTLRTAGKLRKRSRVKPGKEKHG